MKRNVMISGEFSISELNNNASVQSEKQSSLPRKAQERIDALRKAGIDTSNLFAMGEEMVVRVVDGVPTQVENDDPIFAKIGESGYVGNYKLYRRWVMAQMFRMLRYMEKEKLSMSKYIQQCHGYEYQWRMVEKELFDQYKMHKHKDFESFLERNLWFNKNVVIAMCDDYMGKLKKYIAGLAERKCKGRPYKTFNGRQVFIKDIDSDVYNPIINSVNRVKNADTPEKLYHAVVSLNVWRVCLPYETKQADAFINAYKGSGGFFTMKNLIMFHKAHFGNGRSTGRIMTTTESLTYLNDRAKEYYDEGWRMIGVMKELISDSGISVERKINEWRKK